MSKEKNNDVIVSIYDFEIKANTLYEVQEKMDSSAPDGFKDNSTSKILSFDVEDGYPGAIYDIERQIWDTGLTENSSAFREAFQDEKTQSAVLRNLNKYIVNPYEKEKGVGALDFKATKEQNEFWDRFRIKIKRGRVFNTANVDDLLQLYLCLIHKRLTPKELESHPAFKQPISYYLIVDKESAISRQAETEMKKMEAQATFFNLMKQDKKGLLSILEYLGIQAGEATDQATLVRVFNNWLEDKTDKYQNVKLFVELLDKYQTPKGKELLEIHTNLKYLYRKGKVKYIKGEISMDDVYVANGWKNASMKIQEDDELKEIFASLLD